MPFPVPSLPELAAAPPTQLALELPAPPANGEAPLLPVRMVNEYVYCPRLAFLEWVDGEWSDSGDTEEGRRAHARIDAGSGRMPEPGDVEAKPDFTARSVMLGSERLGIIAKLRLSLNHGLDRQPRAGGGGGPIVQELKPDHTAAAILHQDHLVCRFLADVLEVRIIEPHGESVTDRIVDHLDLVHTVSPIFI